MAQSPAATGGATVHGNVVDPDSALVGNATATLTPASGKAIIVPTKTDGTYTFRGVPSGTYSLTITAPGFAPFVKEGLTISAGQNLTLDAKLVIQEQNQVTTVTAETVQLSVDPENNASSTVISGAALDALSDDPDELQTELQALAGPSAGPNGGQIYIDGFTGGQLPPKSSIREIRINQNPFSAQYDQLGYGRIEVFTKPGTDKFHGNFSTQFGDKFLNTSSPFLGTTNSQPDYHTLFFTGSVTGPVRKGMSFTLSGSHRNIDNNAVINPTAFYATSATSTTLCAPGPSTISTCGSYPFPTAYRALAEPQTRWDISPRIDIAIGDKNTVTARYQYETGSSNINPAIPSLLLLTGSNSSSSESEIQISDTQLISSKVINETRFEYQHTTSNSTPLSTGPAIGVSGVFSAGGSGAGITSTPGDHIEIQNYTSIALAKNFIRLGGRLRTSSESPYSTGGQNGSLTYSYLLDPCTDPTITNKPSACAGVTTTCADTVSSYQCGLVNQFKYTHVNNPTISARETDLGLYAEDDWKARPNLTISYGIRMEAQNVIASSHDFAPRISVAYGIPRKNGRTTTVVRGGFGMFYNRFALGSIAGQITNNGQNTVDYTTRSPSAACSPNATLTGFSAACLTASSTPTTQTLGAPGYGIGLRSPYTIQSALTVEQQVGKYASLSMTYLNARGEHQFLTRYLADPNNLAVLDQTDQSEGIFRQNQINTNINVRTPKGITIFGFYAASWANSNISNITDPIHPSVDYGRAAFAVRSRLTIGGSIPLPWHVTASPLVFANSGSPYNVTTGVDENGDTLFTDRPYFAQGTSANCQVASSFYSPAAGQTVPSNLTQVPVNYCTGPANVAINLRLSRTFGFGPKTAAAQAADARAAAQGQGGPGGGMGGPGGGARGGGGGFGGGGGGGARGGGGGGRGGGGSNTGRKYNLNLGAQAQNLFNEIPYGTPTSTLTSSLFGKPTSLQGGVFASGTAVRRITLQASFNF